MLIYEPKGAAREYGELACNIYSGCVHGCKYCYAPSVLRKNKDIFHANSTIRVDFYKKLIKELKKQDLKGKEIFLCFTSDPYQQGQENITGEVIKAIHEKGAILNVLTKNPQLAIDKDIDLLKNNKSKLGTTLVFKNDEKAKLWEPNAPEPSKRIKAIKEASIKHELFTWISIEPTIETEEGLEIIQEMKDIVDVIKVGKLNHQKTPTEQNWTLYIDQCLEIFANCNKTKYYIKDDLWRYASDNAKRQKQTNI